MASRVREETVPKLRISFQQLQKKCSQLLLDGFESKPAENCLDDLTPSSSCNENDGVTNLCNAAGQSRVESPRKGAGGGGLFQIKPTSSPQGVSLLSKGSRLDARRRSGSEQPERKQTERRFHIEDEAGGLSEPTNSMSARVNRRLYNITSSAMSTGRTIEEAEGNQKKGLLQTGNGRRERERTRVRRHTDDGRHSDHRFYSAREQRQGMITDSRRDHSSGHRPSSSTASEKDSALLADWQRYTDGRIQKSLSKFPDNHSKLAQILHACSRLQETGRGLLLSSLEVSTKQEVTSKMWKVAHYPIIEVLRDQATETEESAQKDQLEAFLKSSIAFYLSLVEGIEERYSFQIPEVLAGTATFQSKTHFRTATMALSFCECFYIYLGDLTRYYEQYIQDKPDWSKPRNYYLKAQSLAPKDGKPYNQLAVVALNAHRRLDACYYYMRSLKSKVPFQSAMDRLVGLFEDASRKAKRVEEEELKMKNKADREAARKKKKAERMRNRKLKLQNKEKSPFIQQFSSGRKEVWIMSGTEVPLKSDQQNRRGQRGVANQSYEATIDDYYTTFTHSEVLKKLVSAFLVTHGKLFTKIGIELFDGSRDRLLHLWLSYWMRQDELTTGDTTRLLKMMVVNIFSIHNAKEMHTDELSARRYIGLAFSLALQLNTTLLDSCTKITELVPACGSPRQLHSKEQDSSSDQSNSSVLLEPVANFSRKDSGGDRCQDEASPEQRPNSEEQDSPVSVDKSPSHELDLANGSPELLCAVDLLSIILPSVRVWLDWMKMHRVLWMGCVSLNNESHIMHKFWTATFNFMNNALDLFPRSTEHLRRIGEGRVSLWEDRMMAGFMPLKENLNIKDTFSISELSKLSTDQLREQCVTRVMDMAVLCQALCDTVNAIPNISFTMKFDSKFSLLEKSESPTLSPSAAEVAVGVEGENTNSHVFESSRDAEKREDLSEDKDTEAVSSDGDDMEGYESDTSSSSSGEDVVVEGSDDSEVMEEDEEEATVIATIEELKAQREALARQLEDHKKAVETVESVLSEAASKEEFEVHIAPKYLVPDTNCYVDLLPTIKTLVDADHFTVAVPLIVLAELEGLSKGSQDPSLKQNATKTTSGAKAAVEFINGSFSSKNSHVKALTTQGNLMSSISFRAEVTGKATNDDLILESCLNLHSKIDKLKANQTDAAEYYSVVLLTDDRNLRVKALANGLPVRDLPEFMKLVNHGST